ncbi:MAG: hypothetical protein A3I73_06110 [Omnitrophica bacterium RIFCSPLOWO2_02_FULL_45_16]|nr:MAG: hypothetical protein A3C51_01815 [Omnitrophica bacterium RIFCSPHIGHO2_02_FULL_46_20]OGW93215.1 MAG: hypothetical protein A3G36_00670 [Omnitrophica bacterium RIFCSPLOWO2_12_FULL_45_13]OGW94965.1 MAG: hypothetical protein A3K16_02560 [Omnitrophica bacterium RIFCSPLOWO2_01_FULL_45_24]OGX01126.1 MAG: hypothetical protein A3I73_06110 [Omnitrophica bacterium RIFCSPLOWO2_02_FULL_45_16]
MKILGISGSPKKEGFTNLLLNEALDGARAGGAGTDKIILNDLDFKPCQACGGCDETGVCVLSDDMRAVYEKLEHADGFIIASPIYFGTVTAQLKAMIDRCQSLWVKKYILKKGMARPKSRKGIFICVAGKDNREYFESAKKIINIFFVTLDVEYAGELFVCGTNKMTNNSKKLKDALLKSYELGLSLDKI